MNAIAQVLPQARPFDSLHAVPAHPDHVYFGRGEMKPPAATAEALRALARRFGAQWEQTEAGAPSYMHAFIAERELAEQPGYAAEVILEAQNHGLLVATGFDCATG